MPGLSQFALTLQSLGLIIANFNYIACRHTRNRDLRSPCRPKISSRGKRKRNLVAGAVLEKYLRPNKVAAPGLC
ncbi:hypothetical protein N431DRAFT_439349 [Stipitochalara longipes BDJ]|nr:hypothetical protein N431DRAFT_439349 [Stipitochalara longipes BDJ]